MGLGAIFGAVNTMYSAVASRTREIATLRALGFQSLPVVISVLVEAVVLSLIGGAIGGLLAYLAFDGYQTATMNWQSFSQVAFAFAVTPALLVQAMIYATIMGLFGGLLPAWKAARMPVVTALRAALAPHRSRARVVNPNGSDCTAVQGRVTLPPLMAWPRFPAEPIQPVESKSLVPDTSHGADAAPSGTWVALRTVRRTI